LPWKKTAAEPSVVQAAQSFDMRHAEVMAEKRDQAMHGIRICAPFLTHLIGVLSTVANSEERIGRAAALYLAAL
jgi:hypothetical protein